MVYFKDSQIWLQQSTLLIEARPTTTKVTTKYRLLPTDHPSLRRRQKPHPATPTKQSEIVTTSTPSTSSAKPAAPPPPPPSRAFLVLKTYDPVSGTCLKYRTDKAAEVGRLVAALGRTARAMAGLPQVKEIGAAGETGRDEEKKGKTEEAVKGKVATTATKMEGIGKDGKGGLGKQGGGGGGKKKKGKR